MKSNPLNLQVSGMQGLQNVQSSLALRTARYYRQLARIGAKSPAETTNLRTLAITELHVDKSHSQKNPDFF